MMDGLGSKDMGPGSQEREAYIQEALGLPSHPWSGYSGEFGCSAEDDLLWTSVLALDEKNTRRALAAGASVGKRREIEWDGGAVPKKTSLFQAWMIAIRKTPAKALAGCAAPVALALEDYGALDFFHGEGEEPEKAPVSRKERRLAHIGSWRDSWPRPAQWTTLAGSAEERRDEALASALLGVIEHWLNDSGPDAIAVSDVAAEVVRRSVEGAKDRDGTRRLALMAALESRFGQMFGAEEWAGIVMRPGWQPSDDSKRQLVDGAIRALAGSSASLDPWVAGWLASLGIIIGSVALVEGVAKRAPAMHWRVPQGALAWLSGADSLWPSGTEGLVGEPVSLVHLALMHHARHGLDIAKALLKNPVLAQGACDNPQPSFLAFCPFEQYRLLVEEFPGLGSCGANGDNVAHAWARLMSATGSGGAERMVESFFKPLLESRFASMAMQKNASGETPAELFEAALAASGASVDRWREAFAKWERREVAAAALAAGQNSAPGATRL